MPKRVKRKSKVEQRLESMSHEEIALKWRQMRPRYFMWLGFFILLGISTYMVNHVLNMQYTPDALRASGFLLKAIGALNVAFQISSIFCILFLALLGMSYIFGKPARTVNG